MNRMDGYRCLLLATGMTFVVGCGLSEYEAKYQKQQERMNYLDEENRLLGPPIEPPGKKDSAGSIRLRLPLGISRNYDEERVGILYRYPKSSSKSEIDSGYVALEPAKDWSQFKKRALEPFKAADPQATRPITLTIPGRPERTFETVSFTDGTDPTWAYRFYFYKDEAYHVAIGFRASEKALASETARQAMEFSVKTLSTGKVAASRGA